MGNIRERQYYSYPAANQTDFSNVDSGSKAFWPVAIVVFILIIICIVVYAPLSFNFNTSTKRAG
jgi:hypothetical protein